MDPKKMAVELHIDLRPPRITEEEGEHRLDLTQNIPLGFVPFPGLSLRLTPKLPGKKKHHWGPLISASRGPQGATGHGMTTDIWTVDRVFYDVKQEKFMLWCDPKLDTEEQFQALRELLTEYYGFHIDRHLPGRWKGEAKQRAGA